MSLSIYINEYYDCACLPEVEGVLTASHFSFSMFHHGCYVAHGCALDGAAIIALLIDLRPLLSNPVEVIVPDTETELALNVITQDFFDVVTIRMKRP